MKNLIKICLTVLFAGLILSVSTAGQSGGQYAITQSVIANGGANSNAGNFAVIGTTAQTNVGANMAGGVFGLTGGFWQPFFAPTAAQVSVSGKVTTANGGGIANVRVLMSNQAGELQTSVTNNFGNFSFAGVLSGETYVFTVQSRRYRFSVPSQVLSVTDNVADLVFIADLQ